MSIFKKFLWGSALLVLLLSVCAFAEEPDYRDPEMWAYFAVGEDMPVDVFFVSPSTIKGSAEHLSADLSDPGDRETQRGGIGMQSMLYGESARFYAPFYREMTMYGYSLPEAEREPYLAAAEADVIAAFDVYMETENDGRPLILAAFSEGADLGLRILKKYGANEAFRQKLVAAYLIGWRVTDEDLTEYPFLRMAQGESDTGVIISFDCEAEFVEDTIIVPAGSFTYSINPLNWRTDSAVATKEENLGYVYPAKDGSVKQEISNLCGAYIDPARGALKVTDITPEAFPPRITSLPVGSYHIYDYEFFYRNLQENIRTRIEAYFAE